MSCFLSTEIPEFSENDTQHSIHEIALAAFFSRSVITPRRLKTVTGFLEELPLMYFQNSDQPSPLAKLTLACALAAYGIRHDSANALEEAHDAYNAGIMLLSNSISALSSECAVEALIMSVLIGLFYEVCHYHTPLSRLHFTNVE
jgi:hypothetical protein